jgi:opacity protein-like surface antigen
MPVIIKFALMLKFFAVILFLFVSLNLQAQTWEIGGAAIGAGYIGDLNPSPFKLSGLGGGLFIKRNFNGYLSAKLNYSFAEIRGADSTSNSQQLRDRNLSFTDPLQELSLLAEFNFMKFIPDVSKSRYTPYIYLGAGITSYTPRAVYNQQTVGLRDLKTEGQSKAYSKYAIVIPYGAGIKYNFSGKWTVGADVGYRYTNTDYLDDVSGVYADKTKLTGVARALSDRSGERNNVYIGSAGTQRGDFRSKDIYMFAGFTLSYTFITEKCYFER